MLHTYIYWSGAKKTDGNPQWNCFGWFFRAIFRAAISKSFWAHSPRFHRVFYLFLMKRAPTQTIYIHMNIVSIPLGTHHIYKIILHNTIQYNNDTKRQIFNKIVLLYINSMQLVGYRSIRNTQYTHTYTHTIINMFELKIEVCNKSN